MTAPLSIAVMISGRGSNMKALVEACASGAVNARPVLVFSDKADAQGLNYAREKHLSVQTLARKGFASREAYDTAVADIVAASGADIICFAGYMRLVTPAFIDRFTDRIINIHPSLLPSFKGTDAQEQAIEAGVKIAGCTVHIVREDMDAGPILVQRAIAVHEDDTAASLSARLIVHEHEAYIEALRLFCDGRISVQGNRAHILPAA